MIPQETASSGKTTAVSKAKRCRVGNPAQSSLWLKTKEKNLGQQELPYQLQAGQLGALGSSCREELQQIIPSSDLHTQKGSLTEHQILENLGRRDSLADPLTPTHLLKSSPPAAASEILRAERKHCQLCPTREGMAVPAAWITGNKNTSCPPSLSPHTASAHYFLPEGPE